MSLATIVWMVAGLVALVAGAEVLVRGASRIAATLGISPLVIGLTVVAFGTSAPELAVSLQSAFAGQPDLALGNVVGSNIFNILLIVGISAVIVPLVVAQQLIRLDVPLMIVASVTLLLFGLDGRINRLDGLILFGGLLAYLVLLVRKSRSESAEISSEYDQEFGGSAPVRGAKAWTGNLALVLAGLIGLVFGSRWLVAGAVEIARALGLSELIVGLTIVAAGTSLPEVATSIVAAVRGERDIAVGNAVGSNIFNILGVLGLASAIAPNGIAVSAAALRFDIPVMIAVAIATLPIFFTGHQISRWEGWVFLAFYVAYTTDLVLSATGNPALTSFQQGMVWFVLPLTAVTIATLAWREIAAKRGRSNAT